MNYKKAFSLFEVIIVILISSIVLIYTFIFTKELYFSNKSNQDLAVLKIDLNSTKIFLEKHKDEIKTALKLENNNLYFEDAILLKDVNNFKIKENSSYFTIDIKVKESIVKTWIIKK